MIELLYTSLSILVVPLAFNYLIFNNHIITNFILNFGILFIFFLYYITLHDNSLDRNKIEYNNIFDSPFYPIINITPTYFFNGTFDYLYIETGDKFKYSIIKAEEYSNECLENYFINKTLECPITDIIVLDRKNNSYNNYKELKISNDKYIYFTNNNKNGQLYREISCFKYNFNFTENMRDEYDDIYDYKYFKKKKQNEDAKLKLKISLNKYENFANIKANSLFFIIHFIPFFITFLESPNPRKFNLYRIINIIIEISTMTISLILFIKFINVKHYYFDIKDIIGKICLNDRNIHKIFNIESFLVSFPLIILFNRIFYFIFPNFRTCCYCEECDLRDIQEKDFSLFNKDKHKQYRIFLFFFLS